MADDRQDESRDSQGGRPVSRSKPRASAPWRDTPPARPALPPRLLEPAVFDLSAEVEIGDDGYFRLRKPLPETDPGNQGST